MGRWGDGEMGRQGDKGTRGQGDKGMGSYKSPLTLNLNPLTFLLFYVQNIDISVLKQYLA